MPKAKTARRNGCFRWGCPILTVLLLFSIYTSIRWVDIFWAARGFGEAESRAKELGMPMTLKDLEPETPIPDDQNGARLMAKSVEGLWGVDGTPASPDNVKVFDTAVEEAFEALKKGDAKVASTCLKPIAGRLDTFSEGAAKPFYYVGRDYDLGIELLFPEYAKFKSMVKALAARAETRALLGDVSGAIRDLQAGRNGARLLANDQTLIGLLVAIAMDAISLKAGERVAQAWDNQPDALARLRNEVFGIHTEPFDFRKSLRSEMYFGLSTMRNIDRYGGPFGFMRVMGGMAGGSAEGYEEAMEEAKKKPIVRSGPPKGMVAKAMTTRMLQSWNEALEGPEWRSGDPIEIGKKLDSVATKNSWEKTRKVSYILVDVMFPVFSQAGNAVVRAEATRWAGYAFVAALEAKARTGDLPKDLESIQVRLPDPFSEGQALRYVRTDQGFKVYSVGPNRKDDGGVGKDSLDVVSEYPYPEKAR